jgi:hydrogenase/urease accessory protein HupE
MPAHRFHGVAHGTEGAVVSALPLSYFSGFLLVTAVLLGAGIVLGHGVSALQKGNCYSASAGA